MDIESGGNYSCKFQNDSGPIFFQMDIKKSKSGNVSEDEVEKISHQILNSLLDRNGYISKIPKKITLFFEGNNCNQFSINDEIAKDVKDLNAFNKKLIHLKIAKLSENVFPKRTRTFSEIYHSILKSLSPQKSVVKFLWKAVAGAAAAIQKTFHPGKTFDTTSLKWVQDPNGVKSVEEAMHEVAELLDQNPDELSQKAGKAFKEGLQFAKDCREGKKEDALQYMSENIVKNEGEQNKCTTVALIPGGHWENGVFEPSLWSFYRDTDGALKVIELGYGQETHSKIREFDFGRDPSQEKIKLLLDNLMRLTEEPPKSSTPSLKKLGKMGMGIKYIEEAKNALGEYAKKPSTKDLPPPEEGLSPQQTASIIDFKESLFIEAGGSPLEIEEFENISPILKISPIKLVYETLRTQFPEVPIQDKVLFSMQIFQKRLSQILAAESTMEKKERAFWLNKLETDYKRLENKIEKSGASSDILKEFTSLESNVKKLRGKCEELRNKELSTQTKQVEKLKNVSQKDFEIEMPEQSIKKTGKSEKLKLERVSKTDLKAIKELDEAFKSKEAKAISVVVEKLSFLSSRMDDLVENKKYEAAIELFRNIMPYIPAPSDCGGKNSVKNIEATGFWKLLVDEGDSNQPKKISDEIGKMTQYFWESKVKTGNLPLKPDEWIFMFNNEAALFQLTYVRKAILDKKMQPVLAGLNEKIDQRKLDYVNKQSELNKKIEKINVKIKNQEKLITELTKENENNKSNFEKAKATLQEEVDQINKELEVFSEQNKNKSTKKTKNED